jgi:CRISPR-associated protein Csd2
MPQSIERRYDFVLLFDVLDGNPNGDPDAGNAPRVDPETGHGLVSDVCLKRKIRNFVGLTREQQPPFDIYVKERGILAREQRKAYAAITAEPGDRPNEQARDWMCKNYYDVRTFGAVMTTGKASEEKDEKDDKKPKAKPGGKTRQWNCGQVRGPVQLTFARSIGPVVSLEHAITRVALTNEGDTGRDASANGEEKASTGQMGRKHTVSYGLYRAHGFVSPHLAADTGFSQEDLDLLWQALINMFDLDRSASRGEMATRRLIVFEHSSKLGNARATDLFDRVQVQPKPGCQPARGISDFEVVINKDALPDGIAILEKA